MRGVRPLCRAPRRDPGRGGCAGRGRPMRHVPVALALAVLLWIALALWLVRPEPPDASLFGAESALAPALAPLAVPLGTLALSGEVHAVDGTPAADAFVVLVRDEQDPLETEPVHQAYTDAEGRFTLRQLAPGSYLVVLTHPSAPPRRFPLVIAPGELAPVSWPLAEPLAPLPALPAIRRAAVEGRVALPAALASPESPAEGFEVVLRRAEDTPAFGGACERRVRTGPDGRFVLDDLVAASYRVEVLPPWARGGSWPVLARAACAPLGDAAAPLALELEVGAL